MLSRIIFLVIIILAVFWLPWWLSIIFALVGVGRFHHFYEVIIPALWFDFLYSASGVTLVKFPLEFSVLAIILVYLAEDLKTRIMIS